MSNLFNFFLAIPKYESPTALPFTKPTFYVWMCCIGFNIAVILMYVLKSVESKFVTALFNSNAVDEESAVAFDSLKIRGKFILKFLLRDNSTLRTTILLVGDDQRQLDEKGKKTKLDFSTSYFYINQEKLERAESLKKEVIKWYLLPIICAVSIGIAIGVSFLMPIFQNWGK